MDLQGHTHRVGRKPTLGLKLVFKRNGSLCDFIHSFSRLRETARVFVRLNSVSVLTHLFLSHFQESSFMWIAVEGGAILLRLSVRRGFNAHTRLRNKDLPTRIRYSLIPKSSDWITWIPGPVRKWRFFFSTVYVCLNAIINLTYYID